MEYKDSIDNYLRLDVVGKTIRVTTPARQFVGVLSRVDFFGRMTVKTIDGVVFLYPKWIYSLEVM